MQKKQIKKDNTSEENAASIQYPHADVVVRILNIDNYNVYRVQLIVKVYLTFCIFWFFSLMKLFMDYLAKYGSLLQGFSDELVPIEGVITCQGWYLLPTSHHLDELLGGQNLGTLGRSGLCALDVVVFIKHLLMKFPTSHGVGQIKGNRFVAWQCYNARLQVKAGFDLFVMGLDTRNELFEEYSKCQVICWRSLSQRKTPITRFGLVLAWIR